MGNCKFCGDGTFRKIRGKTSCSKCFQERRAEEIKKIYDELLTWGKDEIICPYCGNEFYDSWEYENDNDFLYCDECKNKFEYTRDIEVTYSTKRMEEN